MMPCSVADCQNTADPRWYVYTPDGKAFQSCDGHGGQTVDLGKVRQILDLAELRRIAEKATPGMLDRYSDCVHGGSGPGRGLYAVAKGPQALENAAFIAAANRDTVLALLDIIEAADRLAESCSPTRSFGDIDRNALDKALAAYRAARGCQ